MAERIDLNNPADVARLRELAPHLAPEAGARAGEGGLDQTAPVSEKRWMWKVIRHAEARGWRYYHVINATMAPPGWPDLVLVRERVIFAELKTRKGKLTRDQESWLKSLRDARAEVYVWLPKHWPEVERTLT